MTKFTLPRIHGWHIVPPGLSWVAVMAAMAGAAPTVSTAVAGGAAVLAVVGSVVLAAGRWYRPLSGAFDRTELVLDGERHPLGDVAKVELHGLIAKWLVLVAADGRPVVTVGGLRSDHGWWLAQELADQLGVPLVERPSVFELRLPKKNTWGLTPPARLAEVDFDGATTTTWSSWGRAELLALVPLALLTFIGASVAGPVVALVTVMAFLVPMALVHGVRPRRISLRITRDGIDALVWPIPGRVSRIRLDVRRLLSARIVPAPLRTTGVEWVLILADRDGQRVELHGRGRAELEDLTEHVEQVRAGPPSSEPVPEPPVALEQLRRKGTLTS